MLLTQSRELEPLCSLIPMKSTPSNATRSLISMLTKTKSKVQPPISTQRKSEFMTQCSLTMLQELACRLEENTMKRKFTSMIVPSMESLLILLQTHGAQMHSVKTRMVSCWLDTIEAPRLSLGAAKPVILSTRQLIPEVGVLKYTLTTCFSRTLNSQQRAELLKLFSRIVNLLLISFHCITWITVSSITWMIVPLSQLFLFH